MEFGSEKRRVFRKTITPLSTDEKPKVTEYKIEERSYNLQMYRTPPEEQIDLEHFEKIAWHRFAVLKRIEEIKESCGPHKTEEFHNEVKKALGNEGSPTYFPVAFPVGSNEWKRLDREKQHKWRRDDVIGNYILRLAFCKNQEDQRWFIANEVELFRYRFQTEHERNPDTVAAFLKDDSIEVEMVDKDELEAHKEEIRDACAYSQFARLDIIQFWKIDFTQASDLVRRRKCFLYAGMAYLPSDDLQYIVCAQYRAQLSATLNKAFKYLPHLQNESQRIKPFLEKLSNRAYVGKEFLGDKDSKLTRHMIDSLSTDFPLCMRNIHQRLRADHHLKHGARQQYGLFLKGIGLSLEEALAFMREEFTKKVDSEKFEKQYAYNIRHMYGKEGRRKDYPALPCQPIILGVAPAAGDCHGCPYKHQDLKVLEQSLLKDGLNKTQVEKISNFVKVSRYDKACTRQFEFARGMLDGGLGQLITHPNQYYELAIQIKEGKRREEHVETLYSQMTNDSTQTITPMTPMEC